MTGYRTIDWTCRDGIAHITFDRPEQLNAFTIEMGRELEDAFARADRDAEVRAVIVTGNGRAFCAGMDLSGTGNAFGLDPSLRPDLADMADLDDPRLAGIRDSGGRVGLAIHACSKPVVAAINGAAVGVGATMTLAMDARLISSHGRFGLVFGRLGITPEATSTWFLPRIVGMPDALDLVYSAEILDAEQAVARGLARSMHDPDALLSAATDLVDRWTHGRSPVATALARHMMYRNSACPDPADAHRVESLSMFYTSIGDGSEGVSAFRERREPVFRQRVPDDLPPFAREWIENGSPKARSDQ
ncbi:crotonase/enoyl-CoA hydratase family protein [Gordonia paraffinivorans]|uniref:crotonase/enoyl-CoA hydratase family protein n=1 Tax=Gordonia paraffinivorans TaxID=175628 RepID=UPI001446F001|nr:crotonase/enoyl-CoA hydratase family protein [Gordonia paraffinivorans]